VSESNKGLFVSQNKISRADCWQLSLSRFLFLCTCPGFPVEWLFYTLATYFVRGKKIGMEHMGKVGRGSYTFHFCQEEKAFLGDHISSLILFWLHDSKGTGNSRCMQNQLHYYFHFFVPLHCHVSS
jgi:hypothetical protein